MDRHEAATAVITTDIPGRKESNIAFADALLEIALKEFRESGKDMDFYGALSAAIYSDVCGVIDRMDDSNALFSRNTLVKALGQRLVSSSEKDPNRVRFSKG